jgi:hypothetical protein
LAARRRRNRAFITAVPLTADSLPDDVTTLKAMLIAAEAARLAAEVKAQNAEAEAKARALVIEQMKFTIANLRHEQYGQSSERGAILEQLELQLADLEEDASEAEAQAQLAAAAAAAAKVQVEGFQRKRRRAVRLRRICRASASSTRHRTHARAAAAIRCARSARM